MTPSCVPCAAVIVGEFMSVGERARSAAEADPGGASIALARPKSRTLTLPSGVSLTFPGLRSRWTIPFSCAASSASAICRATARASSRGSGAALQPLGEVLALDELHDEGADAARLLEAVDRGDVRVLELGEELRLALEAGEAVGVGGERLGEDLDRDLALQLRVGRAVDDPHPALAERAGDLVAAEAGSRAQAHRALPPRFSPENQSSTSSMRRDGRFRVDRLDAQEAGAVPRDAEARVPVDRPEEPALVDDPREARGERRAGRHGDAHQPGAALEEELAAVPGPEGLRAAVGRDEASLAGSREGCDEDLLARRDDRLVGDPPAVGRDLGVVAGGRQGEEAARRAVALERQHPGPDASRLRRSGLVEQEDAAVRRDRRGRLDHAGLRGEALLVARAVDRDPVEVARSLARAPVDHARAVGRPERRLAAPGGRAERRQRAAGEVVDPEPGGAFPDLHHGPAPVGRDRHVLVGALGKGQGRERARPVDPDQAHGGVAARRRGTRAFRRRTRRSSRSPRSRCRRWAARRPPPAPPRRGPAATAATAP